MGHLMKPLIWKELRENVRWLPVGWVIMTFVCLGALPDRDYLDAGLSTRLASSLALLAPLMAFSLGLLQSVRDTQPAAGAYLQHRCVSERQVFWSKMIAALAIYLAVIVLPILLLAGWIALRGLENYPMRPIEVVPALSCSMLAFSLHPATLIMRSRPAFWWGTRWFPLAFAIAVTGMFSSSVDRYELAMSLMVGAIAIAVVSWLSLTALSYWRDSGTRTNRWLRVAYLCVCSLVIVSTGVSFVLTIGGETKGLPNQVYDAFELDVVTKEPWLLAVQFETDKETQNQVSRWRVLSGTPIDGSPVIDPTTPVPGGKEFTDFGFSLFNNSDRMYSFPDQFIRHAAAFERSQLEYFYDNRGYLLGYQTKPNVRWVRTIAADGVYPGGQLVGRPFTQNPTNGFKGLYDAGYPRPLIDHNGVYAVDDDSNGIRTMIEGPIDHYCVTEPRDGATPRVLILSQGTMSEYRFVDTSGSEDWYEAPPEGMKFEKLQSLARHELIAELVQSAAVPTELLDLQCFEIAATDTGFIAYENDRSRRLFRFSSGKPAEVIEFSLVPGTAAVRHRDRFNREIALIGLHPGVSSAMFMACDYFYTEPFFTTGYYLEAAWMSSFQTRALLSVFAGTCFVAMLLVVIVAWKYELSRSTSTLWCLSVLALGLAAPLAIFAIYDRPRRESCPACGKSRRIDEATCEHCSAAWEESASECIEIVDRAA